MFLFVWILGIYKCITFKENLHCLLYMIKKFITVKIAIWLNKMSFSKAKLKRFNEITGNLIEYDKK